eukprot:159426-Hanusia_phi.AAC.1
MNHSCSPNCCAQKWQVKLENPVRTLASLLLPPSSSLLPHFLSGSLLSVSCSKPVSSRSPPPPSPYLHLLRLPAIPFIPLPWPVAQQPSGWLGDASWHLCRHGHRRGQSGAEAMFDICRPDAGAGRGVHLLLLRLPLLASSLAPPPRPLPRPPPRPLPRPPPLSPPLSPPRSSWQT